MASILDIEQLRSWTLGRKIFFFVISAYFSFFCFSNFSFSARENLNYLHIAVSCLLVLLIMVYVLKYSSIELGTFALVLLILFSSVLLSSLLNGKIMELQKSVFLNGLLALAIYQFVRDKKWFSWFLLLFVIGGLLFCAYYTIHYWKEIISFDFGTNSNRLGVYFDNQNGVAKNLALISIASFFFVIKKRFYAMGFGTLLALFLLGTTGSMSGIGCAVISIFLMAYLSLKKKGRIIAGLILGLLIIAFIALIQLPQLAYFKTRITNILISFFSQNTAGDNSANERLELANDAFLLFITNPLFGYGPNAVVDYTIGGYAHNNFAELLADYGMFSFVAFELLIIIPLKNQMFNKGVRAYENSVAIIPILFFIFFFQFFLVTFYTKTEYILLPLAYSASSPMYSPNIKIELLRNGRFITIKKNTYFVKREAVI